MNAISSNQRLLPLPLDLRASDSENGVNMAQAQQLPTEICESIIDHFVLSGRDYGIHYTSDIVPTLYACCLTCRAWLPRSQSHLYRTVVFRRPRDIDLFLRTITLHPHLGLNVKTLLVDPASTRPGETSRTGYLSFARHELVKKCPNVHHLSFVGVDWRSDYPAWYRNLVAQYRITKLELSFEFDTTKKTTSLSALLRLVWGLECLRDLFISLGGFSDVPDREYREVCAAAQCRGRCSALRVLGLREDKCPMTNFPPPLTLGTAVEELTLWWSEQEDGGTSSSYTESRNPQALLGYISSLNHSLKALTLIVNPDDHGNWATVAPPTDDRFARFISSIMTRLRNHDALHTIEICFFDPVYPIEILGSSATGASRYIFLRHIINSEVASAIGVLPSRVTLVFCLPRGGIGERFSEPGWWEAEIRKRLPAVKAQISVRLSAPHVPWAELAWIPEEEDHPDYRYPQNIPIAPPPSESPSDESPPGRRA